MELSEKRIFEIWCRESELRPSELRVGKLYIHSLYSCDFTQGLLLCIGKELGTSSIVFVKLLLPQKLGRYTKEKCGYDNLIEDVKTLVFDKAVKVKGITVLSGRDLKVLLPVGKFFEENQVKQWVAKSRLMGADLQIPNDCYIGQW
jgi:hypothetical protein